MRVLVTILFLLQVLDLSAQDHGDSIIFARPRFFEYAFSGDSSVRNFERDWYQFSVKKIGYVEITSGKISLSNIEGIGRTEPFNQVFPLGRFPVEAAIGGESGDSSRLVYCRILFSNVPVVRWEYALRHGEISRKISDFNFFDPCRLAESDFPMLVLADSTSHKNFIVQEGDFLDGSHSYDQSLLNVAEIKVRDKNHLICLFAFAPVSCYSTYIGFDKSGNISKLLVDPGNFVLQLCEYEEKGCR